MTTPDWMTDSDAEDGLSRLFEVARRGKYDGASAGERRAAALVAVIVEHGPGVDDGLTEGCCRLLRLVQERPMEVRDVLVHLRVLEE